MSWRRVEINLGANGLIYAPGIFGKAMGKPLLSRFSLFHTCDVLYYSWIRNFLNPMILTPLVWRHPWCRLSPSIVGCWWSRTNLPCYHTCSKFRKLVLADLKRSWAAWIHHLTPCPNGCIVKRWKKGDIGSFTSLNFFCFDYVLHY